MFFLAAIEKIAEKIKGAGGKTMAIPSQEWYEYYIEVVRKARAMEREEKK